MVKEVPPLNAMGRRRGMPKSFSSTQHSHDFLKMLWAAAKFGCTGLKDKDIGLVLV